jgi:hypothetical protein
VENRGKGEKEGERDSKRASQPPVAILNIDRRSGGGSGAFFFPAPPPLQPASVFEPVRRRTKEPVLSPPPRSPPPRSSLPPSSPVLPTRRSELLKARFPCQRFQPVEENQPREREKAAGNADESQLNEIEGMFVDSRDCAQGCFTLLSSMSRRKG